MAIRVVEISNGGVQNYEDFCLRINILIGNYLFLRIGLVGASEVLKKVNSFKGQLLFKNWCYQKLSITKKVLLN